jgi:hypothetical protein
LCGKEQFAARRPIPSQQEPVVKGARKRGIRRTSEEGDKEDGGESAS